ncbi:ATP-binding protein [Candidatus Saccharibacteria bacterium]|nr:ATP-binding protein [Candidatus Saccharibacteria bacterium]
MNILTMPFHSITFENVVAFCKTGALESFNLDYKKNMTGSLSKHFATFSNTFGGLIIIGVEEDSTGRPSTYDGIVFDAKLIDQIHQHASNVDPFPRYSVRATDEVKGKVFILIKIAEGDQPPYMPTNDLTIKMRTGNVSTPLRNPDSRELEKLYEKRAKAPQARANALDLSYEVYRAALRPKAEKRHAEKSSAFALPLSPYDIDVDVPYRISILPVAPADPIIDYRMIKARMDDYQVQSRYDDDFPRHPLETIPRGIMFSSTDESILNFEYGTVLDNGLIDNIINVLYIDPKDDSQQLWMTHLTRPLIRQLEVARKFYNLAGFNGLLNCRLTLDNAKGLTVYPLAPSGWPASNYGRKRKLEKIDSYEWELPELDTFKLSDKAALISKVTELIEQFYWDFGMEAPHSEMIKAYFDELGWSIPSPAEDRG